MKVVLKCKHRKTGQEEGEKWANYIDERRSDEGDVWTLCLALLSHHVLFRGLLHYQQTSVEMSLSRSICHHIALALWAKCGEAGYQIAHGDEPEMNWIKPAERERDSCCSAQLLPTAGPVWTLCAAESLEHNKETLAVFIMMDALKCYGLGSNRRTCFVVM